MVYYFKKGKNATETEKKKKICTVCGEKAVTEYVKSDLQSFMLEISCCMVFHGPVDQLKLIAIKLSH